MHAVQTCSCDCIPTLPGYGGCNAGGGQSVLSQSVAIIAIAGEPRPIAFCRGHCSLFSEAVLGFSCNRMGGQAPFVFRPPPLNPDGL
eukprot:1181157-Alexandrium_andersonii.AAC.1